MKRCFALLVLSVFATSLLAQQEEGRGTASGAAVNTTGKGYSAAMVIEPTTKRILFEENAHVPLPTLDVIGTEGIVIACFLAWRYARQPTWGRLLGAAVTDADGEFNRLDDAARPQHPQCCLRLRGHEKSP